MTAAVASKASLTGDGLRPYDARRDMVALANLIETAFGDRLDDSGRRMISEMRLLGRAGWIGWVLSRWLLPPAANPNGFVWESNGQVVGNSSLLPVENFHHRWVIANVAVLPEFRREGIAGSLVDASVEYAQRCGARKLILQVDTDNEQAISLYQRRRFNAETTRTVWTTRGAPVGLNAPGDSPVRQRVPSEWRAQWSLAKRVHPEGVIWPYPTVASLFRPSMMERLFSAPRGRHWVWFEGQQLIGSLSIRLSGQPGVWRLVMVVEPEYRGSLEADLLAKGLENYRDAQWSFVLEYPYQAAGEVMQKVGFIPQRSLTWMARSLE